ncbi:MAG: type I-E CRISPR-associated endonuclease Cas1 [Lentisphaeria bacterium]|nr:type I-E CRISPR-associated endonuclease Cas1 [Lentisphaeria bacterium]
MPQNRILLKTTLADLPRIRDRYPFIYLEHGRMEIDDSSVKWISADREVFRLPAAAISTILLGPGTSVTHEAVKVLATLNTTLCWIGEDSLFFYAVGQTPTANTRNLKKQLSLASDPDLSLGIAKKMFAQRFPEVSLRGKKLKDLMVMEGARIQMLYASLAEKYRISWQGRSYTPGKFELSDLTNQLITGCNTALYGLVSSVVHALGLSPRIGFVHSGSPLPFVYDIADLYKEQLVFDLAFSLTAELCGVYDRLRVLEAFRQRVIEFDLLKKCPEDINSLLDLKSS